MPRQALTSRWTTQPARGVGKERVGRKAIRGGLRVLPQSPLIQAAMCGLLEEIYSLYLATAENERRAAMDRERRTHKRQRANGASLVVHKAMQSEPVGNALLPWRAIEVAYRFGIEVPSWVFDTFFAASTRVRAIRDDTTSQRDSWMARMAAAICGIDPDGGPTPAQKLVTAYQHYELAVRVRLYSEVGGATMLKAFELAGADLQRRIGGADHLDVAKRQWRYYKRFVCRNDLSHQRAMFVDESVTDRFALYPFGVLSE